MRFTTSLIVAYIAYTGSAAYAAPIIHEPRDVESSKLFKRYFHGFHGHHGHHHRKRALEPRDPLNVRSQADGPPSPSSIVEIQSATHVLERRAPKGGGGRGGGGRGGGGRGGSRGGRSKSRGGKGGRSKSRSKAKARKSPKQKKGGKLAQKLIMGGYKAGKALYQVYKHRNDGKNVEKRGLEIEELD